jgi:Fe-S cluster assembly ATPase SufC
MLTLLNAKIEKYLLELDANCKLTFDEYFEEKIINEKGFECSYFNFSSGERRTIDISVMFAFMEIQKILGKFETNVEFYDELIDSSLDERGVECVLEILKERAKTKGIYLITHRKEIDNIVSGEIVWLRKENGLTSRVILDENDK